MMAKSGDDSMAGLWRKANYPQIAQPLCSVHASWLSDATPEQCQGVNPEMN